MRVRWLFRGVMLPLLAGVLVIAAATSAGAAAAPIAARPIMGTAVRNGLVNVDSRYTSTLLSHYRMVTPETATNWRVIEPQQGVFNFAPLDEIMNFATQHHLQVQGLPLVWWGANPTWLTHGTFTRAELISILQNHIRTIVSHYAGRISIWNVVEEVVGIYAPNLWSQGIGPEYLGIAYRAARAADPTAKLYYNDIGGEVASTRQTAALNLVKYAKAQGVPIDGVGLEMHTTTAKTGDTSWGATSTRVSAGQFGRTLRTYQKLGLDVAITEMDVRIFGTVTPKALKDQAKVYAQVYKMCVKVASCKSMTTWGFSDRYSWIPNWTKGAAGAALPFDVNYAPKPAAHALFG